MVLRPFPALDPDHVVMIAETSPKLNYRRETVSPPNFLDWRAGAGTVAHLSAILWWDANKVEREDPERLQGMQVWPEFFDALAVRPALGRTFVRDEETFGRHPVVVLSDGLWKRRFDGDSAIVGRNITIDGDLYQVIRRRGGGAGRGARRGRQRHAGRRIELDARDRDRRPPGARFAQPADRRQPDRDARLLQRTAHTAAARPRLHRRRSRDAAPVAIVSESMARKYWPGEDPIGRRVRIRNSPWITIVGVAGDIIQDWFDRRNVPTIYRPLAQVPAEFFGMAVRTSGDPAAAAGAVRQALLKVDPAQPVFEMMTMRRQLKERTIGLQYLAAVMTVFGGLALFLAAVGLYAVIAYLVAQRRHEIGLRMALGATPRDVLRLTVGQALRLTLAGTGIGPALSLALSRLMEAGMLGIASGDLRVLAAFASVLIATALLAGYIPARRAAAIDPMVAPRTE